MPSLYDEMYNTFSPVTKLQKVSGNAVVSLFNIYECDNENIQHSFLKVVLDTDMDILHKEVINLMSLSYVLATDTNCKMYANNFMNIQSFCAAPIIFTNGDLYFPHNINSLFCKDKEIELYPCILCPAVKNAKSLESFISDMLTNDKITKQFFKYLQNFYDALIIIADYTGFSHNDMHANNIVYDDSKQKFVLIDYGRAFINESFTDLFKANVTTLFNEFSKTKIYHDMNMPKNYRSLYTNDVFIKQSPTNDLDPIFADMAGLSLYITTLLGHKIINTKTKKYFPIYYVSEGSKNDYYIVNTDTQNLQNILVFISNKDRVLNHFIMSLIWLAYFIKTLYQLDDGTYKFRVDDLLGESPEDSVMYRNSFSIWPHVYKTTIKNSICNTYNFYEYFKFPSQQDGGSIKFEKPKKITNPCKMEEIYERKAQIDEGRKKWMSKKGGGNTCKIPVFNPDMIKRIPHGTPLPPPSKVSLDRFMSLKNIKSTKKTKPCD